jgi:hypothetical protein
MSRACTAVPRTSPWMMFFELRSCDGSSWLISSQRVASHWEELCVPRDQLVERDLESLPGSGIRWLVNGDLQCPPCGRECRNFARSAEIKRLAAAAPLVPSESPVPAAIAVTTATTRSSMIATPSDWHRKGHDTTL